MRKRTKFWIIIATFLIVVGGMLFMGVMQKLNWDFKKLSTIKYETNEYEIQEAYDNISILTNTSDVEILMSQDNSTKIICCEQEKVKHAVTVKNNTLEINVEDARKWYEHIGIAFGGSKITIYLPQRQYEKISIKDSTGNVLVESISVNSIYVEVSTGNVSFVDIACKEISSKGSTGNVFLKKAIAKEKISIERSTGDVKFEESDARDIFVKTDTGNVKGMLLSDKVYIVETKTGSIDVPKTTSGGVCEITTSTGDIKIRVK